VERLPQVAASLLLCIGPYLLSKPTKTRITTRIKERIASPNCRSSLSISSALSPRAKALARDASHPKVARSGISWPDLEAGQSQPRAESLGLPPSTPRPSAHSWPRRPARSAVIFLRLRLAADMTWHPFIPRGGMTCRPPSFASREPRAHPQPARACFTTADVFLNAGATYRAPPRTPSCNCPSALCVMLRLFWTFHALAPLFRSLLLIARSPTTAVRLALTGPKHDPFNSHSLGLHAHEACRSASVAHVKTLDHASLSVRRGSGRNVNQQDVKEASPRGQDRRAYLLAALFFGRNTPP